MPSWCTPLPFLAKQYCMYSTATMGHAIHNPCHDQKCWPVQSFKKAEAWEGLIHGSVIYAAGNSALITDICTLQHNLFTTSNHYYCMCMCQYS